MTKTLRILLSCVFPSFERKLAEILTTVVIKNITKIKPTG